MHRATLYFGLSAALCGCDGAAARPPGEPPAERPVAVNVATATRQDVPIDVVGIGNVTAQYTVLLRPQVDGRLDRVHFVEGQRVKAGDLLAQLDLRPFTLACDQAAATVARDRATLRNAQLGLTRNQDLQKQHFVALQALTDQQALVDQAAAQLRADQAALHNAQLQLEYAHVRAPMSGRVGMRLTDPGNLVHASDPNGLVLLTTTDPVAVVFALPEDNLPRVLTALRDPNARAGVAVTVLARDGKQVLGQGRLAVVDNQINAATATLRLKALIDNPDDALWPNQFVKVRLRLQVRRQALVVPTAAVQYGPQGTFAYLVDASQHAVVRPLRIGPSLDDASIVEAGLQAGERVVVEGQALLRPGSLVKATAERDPADAAARPL